MDVNQTIVKVLEEVGVDYVFGGSGQVNASMLLALNQSEKIKTVIIQNEQAASFMAAGYAMFSKKLGVCFATGGPGAFNLFSGLAVAYSDSILMLAITGYPSRAMRGKGALNETSGLSRTPDSQAMFAATTKKSVILEDVQFTVPTLEELIYTAFEGRPGPVHLHIPKDLSFAEVPNYRPVNVQVPKILADEKSTAEFCAGFAENFSADKKPLLMVGYGCIRSGAKNILEKLINKWQIPFVSTMDAKGYISEDNPLSLGIVGTSGDVGANDYFHSAQTVLAVGNSFAENATFGFNAKLFDGKKLFHINIDRHEIDKVYASAFRLVSDATPALESLVDYLEKNKVAPLEKNLAVRKKHHDEILPEMSNGKRHPGFLVQEISKQLPENAIIMGDAGKADSIAYRIAGSEDIYDRAWRGDCASVNFITCHDDFTLYDLFAYNDKHNEANGWNNSDGGNDNHSWNCGWEGDIDLPDDIKNLRHKMIKNAAAILLSSIGVPMILAGDEFGNTQYGNNNPYCQDNKISWLDWNDLQKNQDLFKFFKNMIAFRKRHPVLMRMSKGTPIGYPAISSHGANAWQFEYSPENRLVGIMFAGKTFEGVDDFIYLGINAHWESHGVWLPALPQNLNWQVEVNTDLGDNAFYENPAPINSAEQFIIGARSVIICTAKGA